MISNHLILCYPLLLLPSIFPNIRVFPRSQFFTSGGQSIGVSASASVLPMSIHNRFPLGLTPWKNPDVGKDWRQEEKGITEDEMVGYHHWFDGHEFEQAPVFGDGQGGLACCSPWGCKESDKIEWLNWAECICTQFTWWCMCAKSLQLCPTLSNPMDCSPSGSSVHGILQTRILEWVAMPSSIGSSQHRDQTQISYVSCFGRWILYD